MPCAPRLSENVPKCAACSSIIVPLFISRLVCKNNCSSRSRGLSADTAKLRRSEDVVVWQRPCAYVAKTLRFAYESGNAVEAAQDLSDGHAKGTERAEFLVNFLEDVALCGVHIWRLRPRFGAWATRAGLRPPKASGGPRRKAGAPRRIHAAFRSFRTGNYSVVVQVAARLCEATAGPGQRALWIVSDPAFKLANLRRTLNRTSICLASGTPGWFVNDAICAIRDLHPSILRIQPPLRQLVEGKEI
jgi:hypothetical protein